MHKWINPKLVIACVVLVFFLFAGTFPKLFTHYTPFDTDLLHLTTMETPPFPPSRLHLMGTDADGRDTFSRILFGILPTLRDATIIVVITIPLSFCLSLLTTLYKTRFIRFVLDILSTTFTLVPSLIVAVLVLELPQVLFSPNGKYWYYSVIIVIETARFVKVTEGDIKLVYEKPFIEGAITAGNSTFGIFRRHMLRWLAPYIMEYIPTMYARILTVMGELGYFSIYNNITATHTDEGIKISTNQLSWPTILAEGSHAWFGVPYLAFFPTLAFCVLILTFRLFAAGLSQGSIVEKPHYWPWNEGNPKRKRLHVLRHHESYVLGTNND